jgi:hypothetical protein
VQSSGNFCLQTFNATKLYFDGINHGNLFDYNNGLHAKFMVPEKRVSKSIDAGRNVICIEGFQAGGGVCRVSMVKYLGHDTNGQNSVCLRDEFY